MFMDTPAEEPFRVLVWIFVGIPVLLLIVWPIVSLALTVVLTGIALQVAITASIVGYIVGIPWAIYRRVRDGEWPTTAT
jgi:membrane associated rhomboid family serine protease